MTTVGVPADSAAQSDLAPPPASDPARVRAAFRAGWLIGRLFGSPAAGPDRPGTDAPDHLASISELSADQIVGLYLQELAAALTALGVPSAHQDDLPALRAVSRAGDWQVPFRTATARLHEHVLIELTASDALLGSAYGLGGAISDATLPPADLTALRASLAPHRVTDADTALSMLAPAIGADAAKAVRGSLHAWSDWATRPYIGRRPAHWGRNGTDIKRALRQQGSLWRGMISGELDPASLLTADAYIEAADAAARRAGHITARVLAHFWYAVAFLVAVGGGLTYACLANAAGTTKFWGVFLTVAGGSATLWRGVRAAIGRLAQDASGPLWHIERDDALRVAATRLPAGASAGRLRRQVRARPHREPARRRANARAARPALSPGTTPAPTLAKGMDRP